MHLSLLNDRPSSAAVAEDFQKQNVLEKLKALDSRIRRKGLQSLDPSRNPLIRIGTESDCQGSVTKNSYGLLNLSWQAEHHPEWAGEVRNELDRIKKRIRETHGVPLRFLIWAGMGGSAEDKSMYNSVGLLRRGPRVYVLDSTDPAKLKNILGDICMRSGLSLGDALKSTLVVGMAMGMTSFEPVVNLEKLSAMYARHKIDSRPNFIYMTLPDSLLDQFGSKQGYSKVELQLDHGNTTAGRHSGPLTRGSLYPLGLASVDLQQWIANTVLSKEEIEEAWSLAAFLHTQVKAGRTKVTLLPSRQWVGVSLWTKQDFEESLGKSEEFGLKVVIGERPKLANYRSPKDPLQDRCFLVVQLKGIPHPDMQKVKLLRRAGYAIATVTFENNQLSRYMQFIHYVVFGIGYLEGMNFVTQPSVELYKTITNRLHSESVKTGSIENTCEWVAMQSSPRKLKWRNVLTLRFDRLPAHADVNSDDAPGMYASILRNLAAERRIEYGELTFFGDMRYSHAGKAMRKSLDRAGERVFRSGLKMPVDIYEGPPMNHSYHEMIIGHGKCFSTVLLSEKPERVSEVDHTADYHRAQFLATQMALAERGRYVVGITLKDLELSTLAVLDEFFRHVAASVSSKRRR